MGHGGFCEGLNTGIYCSPHGDKVDYFRPLGGCFMALLGVYGLLLNNGV